MSVDSRSPRPQILTVGAYERDNFGDLLFLLVTERYLDDCDVVASAPFAADMTELLDRRIVALGDELTGREVDAVWTVGGQVGGTALASAFRMSKTPEEYAAYLAAPPTEQRSLLDAALHGAAVVSPYLPTPGAFERNAGVVSVLNSVGLAGVAGLPAHIREEVVDTLRTTDVISVRDRESSIFLDKLGISHTLAPDVVHAISLLEPYDPDPGSDIAVVQSSAGLLEKYGYARVARNLARSSQLAGLRLQFLMAGAASGHDSLESLERLADRVRKIDPGREIEILTERRPLDVVHQIRQARVVIGTSLHVRIIAAAYGLPRVTLERVKPARYATHWDDSMPFDVPVRQLDDALGAAVAAAARPEVRSASDELSRLADANVRAIADQVRGLAGQGADAERRALAERRQRTHRDIAARRGLCDQATDRLRGQLATVRGRLEATRADLETTRAELDSARSELERLRAEPTGWRALGRQSRQRS